MMTVKNILIHTILVGCLCPFFKKCATQEKELTFEKFYSQSAFVSSRIKEKADIWQETDSNCAK